MQPANFSTRTERKVLQLHGTDNEQSQDSCMCGAVDAIAWLLRKKVRHKIFHSHTAEFDRELRAIEF